MKNVLALLAFCLSATAARAAPNIVYIMADDMGYGDVQALNPRSTIPTPHIDRIAAEGMTFTDGHSSSGVCTPTRYSVVTGRYSWRSRLKRGVLNGYSGHLIDPARETVASFLGKQGYDTAVVGKWHLGIDFAKKGKELDFTQPVGFTPNVNGFDFSYIIPASLDFPPYVYVRDDRVTEPETVDQPAVKFPGFLRKGPRSKALVMDECLHHLTGQVTEYIAGREKAGKPFFLYFPLSAPHKPVLPHPDFRGTSGLGPYGDFVKQVDWTVGQVLTTLDEAGLTDRTLLIYSSDNGSFMYRQEEGQDHVADATVQAYDPKHHTANADWRGTKADIWEGGHRVPFLARWPGTIKPGSRCATPVCSVDLFATCAEAAGAELPDDVAEDSLSLVPMFKDPEAARGAPVIHHSASGMFAIRDGKWKLVAGNGSGGREAPKGKPFAKPYHLFDMEADPGETRNLIESETAVAAKLEAELRRIMDTRSR